MIQPHRLMDSVLLPAITELSEGESRSLRTRHVEKWDDGISITRNLMVGRPRERSVAVKVGLGLAELPRLMLLSANSYLLTCIMPSMPNWSVVTRQVGAS